MPVDPRDVNMPDLLAPAPTVGPLFQNPGATFSPRLGAAWNIGGSDRTSLRGGYGLYYTLNNQQDLIVTVTNPPATPRVVIGEPDVSGAAVRTRRRRLGAPDPGRHRLPARPHVERERAAEPVGRLGGDDRLRRRAGTASLAQRRRQRARAGDPRRRHAVLSRRAWRVPTGTSRRSSSSRATATPGTRRSSWRRAGSGAAGCRCRRPTPGRSPRTRRRTRRSSRTRRRAWCRRCRR